jgi:hypothetical protein
VASFFYSSLAENNALCCYLKIMKPHAHLRAIYNYNCCLVVRFYRFLRQFRIQSGTCLVTRLHERNHLRLNVSFCAQPFPARIETIVFSCRLHSALVIYDQLLQQSSGRLRSNSSFVADSKLLPSDSLVVLVLWSAPNG